MALKEQRLHLNRVRIAAMSSLLILLFSTFSVFAGRLPHNISGAAIGFFTGVIMTLFIASPIEWVIHRYVYHRSFSVLRRVYTIHLAHHHLYFPTWRYVTGGPARRIPITGKGVAAPQISRLDNAATYLAHFLFYLTLGAIFICAPGWLISRSTPFLAGLVTGTIVISNLFITVHDAIHRPGSHRMMETKGWFCFLDEHHYIHHVDTEANVNFLLPLADWLFGTLRRKLTYEETVYHGSRENAKSVRVGTGEPVGDTSSSVPEIAPVVAEIG